MTVETYSYAIHYGEYPSAGVPILLRNDEVAVYFDTQPRALWNVKIAVLDHGGIFNNGESIRIRRERWIMAYFDIGAVRP